MFGYLITFILVFLTHPGVAYNWFDPGVGGGMFQGLLVLLLQYPSDISTGFKNAMTIIYWVIFGVWAYINVQLLLQGGAGVISTQQVRGFLVQGAKGVK